MQQYEQDVSRLKAQLDQERHASRQLQRQFDLLQAQTLGSLDVSRLVQIMRLHCAVLALRVARLLTVESFTSLSRCFYVVCLAR